MKVLLVFLVFLPTVSALGVAPASLELSLEPGDKETREMIGYDVGRIETSTDWIHVDHEESRLEARISIPADAEEGVYKEFILASASSSPGVGVLPGVRIPVEITVRKSAFPVSTGLAISGSIVIAGLAAYGVLEKKKVLK